MQTVSLVVKYKGIDAQRRREIARCAEIGGAEVTGSGYCFGDGLSDVVLLCTNEEHAALVGGIVRGYLPDVLITAWS